MQGELMKSPVSMVKPPSLDIGSIHQAAVSIWVVMAAAGGSGHKAEKGDFRS
jgi:hypothetical protein